MKFGKELSVLLAAFLCLQNSYAMEEKEPEKDEISNLKIDTSSEDFENLKKKLNTFGYSINENSNDVEVLKCCLDFLDRLEKRQKIYETILENQQVSNSHFCKNPERCCSYKFVSFDEQQFELNHTNIFYHLMDPDCISSLTSEGRTMAYNLYNNLKSLADLTLIKNGFLKNIDDKNEISPLVAENDKNEISPLVAENDTNALFDAIRKKYLKFLKIESFIGFDNQIVIKKMFILSDYILDIRNCYDILMKSVCSFKKEKVYETDSLFGSFNLFKSNNNVSTIDIIKFFGDKNNNASSNPITVNQNSEEAKVLVSHLFRCLMSLLQGVFDARNAIVASKDWYNQGKIQEKIQAEEEYYLPHLKLTSNVFKVSDQIKEYFAAIESKKYFSKPFLNFSNHIN